MNYIQVYRGVILLNYMGIILYQLLNLVSHVKEFMKNESVVDHLEWPSIKMAHFTFATVTTEFGKPTSKQVITLNRFLIKGIQTHSFNNI